MTTAFDAKIKQDLATVFGTVHIKVADEASTQILSKYIAAARRVGEYAKAKLEEKK